MLRALVTAAVATCLALLGVAPVRAQPGGGSAMTGGSSDEAVRDVPGLDKVAVDEHLERKLPLDLHFTDHTGKQVQLGDYFGGERPVLLTLNYYTCPSVCSMILESTAKTMAKVPWTAGDEYEIVTLSIDPRDTPERAADKREQMLGKYGKSDQGWHFLVGEQQNIERVADAVGFRYFYDQKIGQYAHPAVIMFATPEGKLARYLYGLQFKATDARIALLEASKGNSISSAEQVILYCYAYDPDDSGYTLVAWRVMQIGGGLTAVVLGLVLLLFWRRELKKRKKSGDDSSDPLEPRQVQS